MNRLRILCAVVLFGAAFAAGQGTGQAAGSTGALELIQGVPGVSVTVSVDGKQVRSAAAVGTIVGPVDLAPGSHEVTFTDPSGKLTKRSSVTVTAGGSSDVVFHRPAALHGTPVVNTYKTPTTPIGPGKARVLLAHTATVAPADVMFDGKIVFTDIANGEFAKADVPAGKHTVALFPTGQTSNPILGPLTVDLAAQTVTMVYAVGSPSRGSMQVIAHVAHLSADGTVVPGAIDTGSAGLAAGIHVTQFGAAPASTPTPPAPGTPMSSLWFLPVAGLAMVLVGVGLRVRTARERRPGARAERH